MNDKKIFIGCHDKTNQQFVEIIINDLGAMITEDPHESNLMIVDLLRITSGLENMNLKYLKPETPAIILSGQINDINEKILEYLKERGVIEKKVIIRIPIVMEIFKSELKKLLTSN